MRLRSLTREVFPTHLGPVTTAIVLDSERDQSRSRWMHSLLDI